MKGAYCFRNAWSAPNVPAGFLFSSRALLLGKMSCCGESVRFEGRRAYARHEGRNWGMRESPAARGRQESPRCVLFQRQHIAVNGRMPVMNRLTQGRMMLLASLHYRSDVFFAVSQKFSAIVRVERL